MQFRLATTSSFRTKYSMKLTPSRVVSIFCFACCVVLLEFYTRFLFSSLSSVERFLQNIWERYYMLYGKNDLYLTTIGTVLTTVTVYWSLGILFLLVDIKNKPMTIVQYRLQKGLSRSITYTKLIKLAQVVLFNQIVVAIPCFILAYFIRKQRGYVTDVTLPSFLMSLRDLVVFPVFVEIGFYYSHRLLHHPLFYKNYHKRHHEWTLPIGISAIYCHPLEHVLSNILPVLIGPVLLNSHITILWLLEAIATAYGIIVHSGYHLPALPSPEFHDYHHVKFVDNFGVFGILDRLHGTDKSFRESNYYKRHFVSLDTKPEKQLVSNE